MIRQPGFEGQERLFIADLTLPDLNLFELNVLTHYPQRAYLIPILRERDEEVQLIFTLHGHMTLEQWLRRYAVDYHDLLSVMEETVNILSRAPEHYLRLDGFCLEPSKICYNTVKKRIELIYLPVRKVELCFEQQWNLLLEGLESFAAQCLKPEGHDLFQSLSASTGGRHERQSAYLKVIRHWFAERSDVMIEEKLETAAHGNNKCELERPFNSLSDSKRSKNYESSEQKLLQPTGDKPNLKKSHAFTKQWHFCEGLRQYFMWLNKRKEIKSMQRSEISKFAMSQESFENIQTSVAAQQKNVRYRPEFEGTTLLSEQEKLQGKLILQNQQTCKIFELSKPVTRLGRNTALCDVIIEDDITIGRLHAEVHRIDHGYFIKDLDSLNGTFLNDQRLDSQTMYKLKGNDRLRLSELEILIV